ncbi:MAG: hypothetical protein V4594_06435 [Bacteroidota bacterium]
MQDKDFDQLFKDKFEDAEIQPAPGLWEQIAVELEPKRKKGMPVYWMSAAAVVLVTLGVTLLAPKPEEKIRLQAAENAAVVVAPATVEGGSSADAAGVSNGTLATASTPLVIAPRLSKEEIKNSLVDVQPQESVRHPVNNQPQETVIAAVTEPQKTTEPVKEVVYANADIPVENTTNVATEAPQPEHRGIRNVGDLVNFVVNRVDKRENKIVQFDTDEDDNSSLVSLNLGIIKIGKRSNK